MISSKTTEDNILDKYPMLITWTCPGQKRFVILATSEKTGMVVYSENVTYPVGYYSNDWNILTNKEHFSYCKEKISLQNE